MREGDTECPMVATIVLAWIGRALHPSRRESGAEEFLDLCAEDPYGASKDNAVDGASVQLTGSRVWWHRLACL